MPQPFSLAPPLPAFTRLSAARPLSAISTTTTILERPSSPSPSLSPSTQDDYERRLKLVDENRAKLAASPPLAEPLHLDLTPVPSPSRPSGPPANELLLEFLLASSSSPVPFRLVLGFNPRSKVEDVKERIRSHWPTEWSKEESVPKRADRIRLLLLGRFLDDWESLDSLRLANGSPTIMHLILKPVDSDLRLTKEGGRYKSRCCGADSSIFSSCCIIC